MSSDDYKVGYERPPLHSRFKKGQSGNPKGRPKQSKNFRTIIQEELDRPITVREAGIEKKIPARRALIRQLLHKALKDDPRAARLLMDKDAQFEPAEIQDTAGEIGAKDAALLAEIIAEARRWVPKSAKQKKKKKA